MIDGVVSSPEVGMGNQRRFSLYYLPIEITLSVCMLSAK